MTYSDLRLNDLDVVLREDVQTASDCETARNLVLTQTEAAPSDVQQAPASLEALRQRLQEKEKQLLALRRELRLRDDRISQLEQLSAEGHGKVYGIQSEQIVAMGLVLESVKDPGVTHRISRITTAIGRAGNNDIVLNASSVSRFHARIVVASDSTYLIDLQSSNGCAVNGERISRLMINSGDIVTFGEVQFRFATGVPKSEVEDRWMDETQVLLDESIVFTHASTHKANTEHKQVTEDTAKAE
jgi:FHA domain